MAEEQTTRQSRGASARVVLQEERYLWMARAFVVMFVLAAICDLILLIALANVTPVMRVQPFYLEAQSKEQQVINVERPDEKTLQSDALKESLVRQYLMARFGVTSDLAELESRWGNDGIVFWMSDQSVYEGFLKDAVKIQQVAQKENFAREVHIETLGRSGVSPTLKADIWHAKLRFTDSNRVSATKKVWYWEVDMAVVFRIARKGMTWKDRLKNPLGFTVVQFGVHKSQDSAEK